MDYIRRFKSIYSGNKPLRIMIPVVVFVTFIFSISYKMLPFNGIIDYVDTVYYFPEGFFSNLSTWVSSFSGMYNSNMFGIPVTGNLPSILGFFGITDNYASYALNYLPVLILCLTVFFVTKKISDNAHYAYFAGFFVILNNFILQQFLIWPGHYFYNVIGLVLLFYQTYKIYKHKEDFNLKQLSSLVLISVLAFHAFFFAMYLMYLVLFFIFYYFSRLNKGKVRFLSLASLTFIGIVSIHLYWLVPFFPNHFFQSISNTYNGNLIPVFNGFKSVANYSNLINYYNYPIPFFSLASKHLWQYLFYFVYFGSIITVAYRVRDMNIRIDGNERKFLLFMLFSYITFFILALGPNEKMLGGVWMYLFDHVPFFGFFRAFTRFLIVSLISTIFIFAIFVKGWAISRKRKKVVVISFAALLLFANVIFFSGNLDGAITAVKIPREYFDINERYFKNDFTNFSFISLPPVPYEAFMWSRNENMDLFDTNTYFSLYFFSKPVIYNDYAMQLQNKGGLYGRVFPFFNFQSYRNFDEDLSRLNVKYILLHKDLINTVDEGKPIKYDAYLGQLKDNPSYSLIEENDYFYLFEYKNVAPILFAGGDLSFHRIFDTKYELIMRNLKAETNLSFLTSFHEGWNLYLTKVSDNDGCPRFPRKSYVYEGEDITECFNARKPFEGEELSYLWKKPVFSDTHSVAYEYANKWTVDPEYIKQNFADDYYRENPDGSVDVEIILYFKPQSYFYLGLIISGTIMFSCLGYLMWDFSKRRNENHVVEK